VVDANLCLSYHTIENRGAVPHELRRALDGWAFGCDVCSEVCPWGRDAPDRSGVLGTHRAVRAPGLASWLETTTEAFPERFVGSPLRRAGRDGIARNAALVLGNRAAGAGERGREALVAAAEADRAPLVREAAVWGLLRGYGADATARASAERALAREPDASARAAMRRTLEHEG
jgi:epoxyqueuosine reductase QueG